MSEKSRNGKQDQTSEKSLLKCIWMMSGTVTFKLCDRNYDCERCPFDRAWLEGNQAYTDSTEKESRRHPFVSDVLTYPSQAGNRESFENVFLHPSHVWARVEELGKVKIGLDDFAQRLVGRVYNVRLPVENSRCTNGNACWWIVHACGETKLPVPVRGIVERSNEKLRVSPSLINQDPYGEGWALCIRPDNLENSLKTFYYGEQAKAWCESELSHLNQELNQMTQNPAIELGTTLPDGGKIYENFASILSSKQQRRIIELFLKGEV